MSDSAITVNNLGKKYIIGHEQDGGYKTLRDVMTNAARRTGRRLLRPFNGAVASNGNKEEFWALKDVSFEIKQGEVVGIIGRNGAGKSTLLKVLSRITEPTRGQVRIKGRVASLLEVGTGFHPELTGRENIFLNGAILGMSKAEIKRKFDEIVEFAEVTKFLDTPVKRYSSGMYVRLAFAVAAHLEPEILIVDEVLAVGDAPFQKKCLGRMKEVGKDGRTVLFVSHTMGAITSLCSRAIWLDKGNLVASGEVRQIVSNYLSNGAKQNLSWQPEKPATKQFTYHSVQIVANETNTMGDSVNADSPFEIVFDYSVNEMIPPGRLAFLLTNQEGATVLSSADTDTTQTLNRPWGGGRHTLRCQIPGHFLAPGRYYLTISEPAGNGSDVIHDSIINFSVSSLNSLASRDGRSGIIMPVLEWREESLGNAAD